MEYVNEYAEAFVSLTNGMLDTSNIEPYMSAIVEALKKQIPQKPEPTPLVTGMKYWYRCPNCYMGITGYPLYCEDCGQSLDWEGD